MTDRYTTIEVWREAARDLGFTFISPFTLPDGDDTLAYVGLVAEFGSHRGTLIIEDSSGNEQSRLMRIASDLGYGFSCMSMSHEPYDRDVKIELLNEWRWCGPHEKNRFGTRNLRMKKTAPERASDYFEFVK
ncbi:MAG: hypothetical protein ABIQ35_14040 [Verrucomicrobiota bacterium]